MPKRLVITPNPVGISNISVSVPTETLNPRVSVNRPQGIQGIQGIKGDKGDTGEVTSEAVRAITDSVYAAINHTHSQYQISANIGETDTDFVAIYNSGKNL